MTYNLGEMVEGKGVYMGRAPIFKNYGLSQEFNVFAAPGEFIGCENKPMQYEFADAVGFVGMLDNFLGHNGLDVASEEALYGAYKNGQYNGEWVLPNYTAIKKVIAANRDAGEFKGSFTKAGVNTFEGPEYYWVLRDDDIFTESANSFCIDTERFLTKTVDDKQEASTRVIRFEPA
ncbi:MAG: hypothetical protein CL561_05325 [Alphaproteobacteria bacterium]|nr:hypothetical protein [Alphaproteobacteria bacterium]